MIRDRFTKYALWLGVAFLLGFLLTGCAKPQPPLTQQGQIAVTDTQVIKGLDILRDAAVDLNNQTPPLLPTNSVRKVVTFHESVVKVIQTTPNGWKPVVLAALGQLQADLPAQDWARIQPYIVLVQTLIGAA